MISFSFAYSYLGYYIVLLLCYLGQGGNEGGDWKIEPSEKRKRECRQ